MRAALREQLVRLPQGALQKAEFLCQPFGRAVAARQSAADRMLAEELCWA
jgi:hypothetical protein